MLKPKYEDGMRLVTPKTYTAKAAQSGSVQIQIPLAVVFNSAIQPGQKVLYYITSDGSILVKPAE